MMESSNHGLAIKCKVELEINSKRNFENLKLIINALIFLQSYRMKLITFMVEAIVIPGLGIYMKIYQHDEYGQEHVLTRICEKKHERE